MIVAAIKFIDKSFDGNFMSERNMASGKEFIRAVQNGTMVDKTAAKMF